MCIYDDEQGSYPASVRPLHSADGRLPGRQLGGADPVEISTPSPTDGVSADTPSPAKFNLTCPAPDSTCVVTDGPFASERVPHSRSSGPVLVHRNSNSPERCISPDTSPPIHTIFLPPIITSEPWIPLSFLGAEKLQIRISDIDCHRPRHEIVRIGIRVYRSQTHTLVLVGRGLWFGY